MDILYYKHTFSEIGKNDNPQELGDESICVCLIDGIEGDYETYEIIITGGETQMKIAEVYGLDNADIIAEVFAK